MPPRRGRPPTPLNPEASKRARLGAELRDRREAVGMTLEDLANVIRYSPQRISDVERAKATPSRRFITACEDALHADGKLLLLLPDAQRERDTARQERADARRAARQAEPAPPLTCEATDSEAGDVEDVEPVNRRGLLNAGAAAALGGLGVASATPAAARDIDPELPEHCMALMRLLERHDGVFGPAAVIDAVRHQQHQIARHREIARGGLRMTLLRVEARLSNFASWLYGDLGDRPAREAATQRTLNLARESDYADVVAYALQKQARWAIMDGDQRRAITLAHHALDVHDATPQTRVQSALTAGQTLAFAGDGSESAKRLRVAEALADTPEDGRDPLGPVVTDEGAPHYIAGDMARCRLWLEPAAAVTAYEDVLRDWPREHVRDGGLEQARLALACAAAGEHDRARAEGRRAFLIAQTTKSATAQRELQRLGQVLKAA
jgi:transcriptional regulator with XRE-family HTH domain